MSDKGCEYCEDNEDYPLPDKCKFSSVSTVDENLLVCGYVTLEFIKISFCPMCGTRLNGDSDE